MNLLTASSRLKMLIRHQGCFFNVIVFLFLSLSSMAIYAAEECSVWHKITFKDGQTACMTDYEFFNLKTLEDQTETIINFSRGAGNFFIASVGDLRSCPILEVSYRRGRGAFNGIGQGGTNKDITINNCEKSAIKEALAKGINPSQCNCELIYDNNPTAVVHMSKEQFEQYSAQYLSLVEPKLRLASFSGKPGSNLPKPGGGSVELVATSIPQQANTPSTKPSKEDLVKQQLEKQQAEKERLEKDRLEKEQKLLAEKIRREEEKKAAEEKRAQLELAKKEEADRLQKLEEERRAQIELVKQQQAEKIKQELAEKARQEQDRAKKAQLEKEQRELAERARIEEERRLAEERRVQVEQARRAKEEQELAEKVRLEQERRLAETKRLQAQLAQIESQKAELISRMQQEQGDSWRPSQGESTASSSSVGAKNLASKSLSKQTTKSVKVLIIGNSNYAGASFLPNPVNDAQAVAKRLTEFGFNVDLLTNGNRKQIINALAKYQNESAKYDVNILFYAGHGIQAGGINYLIPTDMPLTPGGSNVEFEAIPVNSVVEKYMQAKTKLVFLDACRDNPLSRSLMTASRGAGGVSRGLAPMDVGGGTLISYSTKDGNIALDGDGKNSPYTEALLTHIDEKVDIALMLRKVRKTVMTKTNGKQIPWDYGSLLGDELILSNK